MLVCNRINNCDFRLFVLEEKTFSFKRAHKLIPKNGIAKVQDYFDIKGFFL